MHLIRATCSTRRVLASVGAPPYPPLGVRLPHVRGGRERVLLVDSESKACGRLGLSHEPSGESDVVLFEPRSGRQQVEISLGFAAASHVLVRDTCSDTGLGVELILGNQDDPGVPTIRLLGKPEKVGEQSELRLEVNSLEPAPVATSRAGEVSTTLGPR